MLWTVVLEKTLESPLDCKEIQPVHPKGNQSWMFIGRTDAEAPILWLPVMQNWLIGKDPDAGKDWGKLWNLFLKFLRQFKHTDNHFVFIPYVLSHLQENASTSPYDPTGCSLPGSSVHGISQARILEWVAISSSRGFPNPGIEPESPALQADFFTHWAMGEVPYLTLNLPLATLT